MRIDLHTHSNRSDGTDSPTELVRNAAQAGLDVVALTDHDTTVGWDEALEAASTAGIKLIRGIEVSTTYKGRSVHVLGYEFDPNADALVDELQRVLQGRSERVPRMLAKLAELGYPLTEADVAAQSGQAAAAGRPHIADALVAKGYLPNRDAAFDGLLNSGGKAYIGRYSTPTQLAIELLSAAGGRTAIAHPWADRDERLTAEDFDAFALAGLNGIEVDHPDHDAAARAGLRLIAQERGLAITGSSDYHGTGKSEEFSLGANTTDSQQLDQLLR